MLNTFFLSLTIDDVLNSVKTNLTLKTTNPVTGNHVVKVVGSNLIKMVES